MAAMSESERDEIMAIKQKQDHITDQTLESTRRMKELALAAEQAGGETLAALESQAEQINRISGKLEEINSDVKQAEGTITDMEKCCGCCTCPWKRQKKFERSKQYKNGFMRKIPLDADDNPIVDQPGAVGGDYITRLTHDAREDEMNSNLGAVHQTLQTLKHQANTMGEELERQNHQLDSIAAKTDSNNARIAGADKRVSRLLGK